LCQRCPLHFPDGEVHPDQRGGDHGEQQPEAALPNPGKVIQQAERDRQHEATEAADQPNHASHGADAAGIVDRDVLVHGRLAQAHEEAKDEGGHHEAENAQSGREGQRAMDALHHVAGRRI
jgi:hypothetical protein